MEGGGKEWKEDEGLEGVEGGGKEWKGRDRKEEGEGDWMGDGQRAPYSIPFLETYLLYVNLFLQIRFDVCNYS